jgi:hypothetical protein
MVTSSKWGLLGCILRVDQNPLLLPEAGLNLNLGSYQSVEQGSLIGPYQVPLCNWNSPHWLTAREAPSPNQHGLVVSGRGSPLGGPGH